MEKHIKITKRSNIRVNKKNTLEFLAWDAHSLVCGIDEVGRGCLAGPVVAAAVILPPYKNHPLLKDSKLLTEKELLTGYRWIIKHCTYSVGIINNRIIDKNNIWQASLQAMERALMNLLAGQKTLPSAILIDAMPINLALTGYNAIQVHYFPKGERLSTSIAAASIIAKVTRDRLMADMDIIFPKYAFGEHKGYATKKHKQAILKHGHTIIHRMSFLSRTIKPEKEDNEEQQTLW